MDRAVGPPGGIARPVGFSFENDRAALVCRRFCDAARHVTVLADHRAVELKTNAGRCGCGFASPS